MKEEKNQKNILNDFSNYLLEIGLSKFSIKNYKSDARQYLKWIYYQNVSFPINQTTAKNYIIGLKKEEADSTINRRLSSLKHFYHFLYSRNLASESEIKLQGQALVKNPNKVLLDFENYLKKEKISLKTIKNYRSDIKYFNQWLNLQNINLEKANSILIRTYISGLYNRKKTSSITRARSSLNRFLAWLGGEKQIPPQTRRIQGSRSYFYKFIPAYMLIILIAGILSIPSEYKNDIASANINFPAKNLTVNEKLLEPQSFAGLNKKAFVYLDKKLEPDIVLAQDAFDTILEINDYEELKNARDWAKYSGRAKIPAGRSEMLILNENIDSESIIQITANSPTGNQMVFVKNQGEGYFKAGIEKTINQDISFSWSIISIY
jgi:site-specific recombinase XerD